MSDFPGPTDDALEQLDSLQPSDLARRLAVRFRGAGQELYLVGGAVRDQLLGQTDVDLDFATSARPHEIVRILEQVRTVHLYRLGEKYGTIGARIGDRTVEITTYRSKEEYPPG